jgi:hypothetical protein
LGRGHFGEQAQRQVLDISDLRHIIDSNSFQCARAVACRPVLNVAASVPPNTDQRMAIIVPRQ